LRNWLAIAALWAVSLTVGPARAWWDGGHMQIAAVAYDRLDPAVRAKVDALIKLNPDYSKWVDGVADANRDRLAFVHASTWADDIKGEDGYTDSGDPRPATTPRETSAMPISCATNIGTISIFLFRPTEQRCVRPIQ
jgi:hypothetical protein